MTYKMGSLFDGSGGFPLAASLCGITPVWAAEIEPYPIAVTRSRFPGMRHLGDISKVNGAEIEPVDVITFGSPCQDLSVAGKRAGLKHADNGDEETTRSGLFMEAVRIIKEMRAATNGVYPRFALWENVPGAFSSNKGEDFRTVLQELIQIIEPSAVMPAVPKNGWPYADSYCGDGWSCAYRVFDAQYWGVPQRRRRIHLIVDFAGQCARNVLFERKGVRGYFETGRTPWQAAPSNAERGASEAACTGNCVAYSVQNRATSLRTGNYQYIFQPAIDRHILDDQGGQQINVRTDGKSPTLRAEMHGNIPIVMQECIPCHDKATRFNGGGPTRKNDGAGNGLGVGKPGDPAPTLSTCDRHIVAYCMTNEINQPPAVVYRKGTRPHSKDEAQVYEEAQVANTLNVFDRGEARANEIVVIATGQGKAEVAVNKATTLNCNHEQPIACHVDCRNFRETPELYGTLQAKPNGGQSLNFSGAVRVNYVVRRLTEIECARLQGFADCWGNIDKKDSLTAEEFAFWLEVRNTHAAINGKAVKEYTEKQMLTWYNKLHTQSAEYKMWGNGIALPPALYCMQGIMDALKKEEATA